MIETSSHFALIPPELLQSALLLQDVTYIPTGSPEFACTNRVSVIQTPNTTDSGLIWDISFRAVTLDNSVREYNGRRYYIGVIMSDGSARIIGTASEAPMVSVTPYPGANEVAATFKAAVPLDL